MPDKKRVNPFAIGIAGVVILIVIVIIVFLLNYKKTARLNTIIAPSFATLTINNKRYKPNQELSFEPGELNIKISADGFQDKEVSVTLTDNNTTNVAEYLIPNDGDISWYENNPKESSLFATVTDAQASQTAEDYYKEYPISEILPYSFADIVDDFPINYRIDGGKFNGCESDYCIKISDKSGYSYEYALNYIQENGYDSNKYQIIYEVVGYSWDDK